MRRPIGRAAHHRGGNARRTADGHFALIWVDATAAAARIQGPATARVKVRLACADAAKRYSRTRRVFEEQARIKRIVREEKIIDWVLRAGIAGRLLLFAAFRRARERGSNKGLDAIAVVLGGSAPCGSVQVVKR